MTHLEGAMKDLTVAIDGLNNMRERYNELMEQYRKHLARHQSNRFPPKFAGEHQMQLLHREIQTQLKRISAYAQHVSSSALVQHAEVRGFE